MKLSTQKIKKGKMKECGKEGVEEYPFSNLFDKNAEAEEEKR